MMKKLLFGIVAAWLALTPLAQAANVNIDGLPAATSVTGTSNLFECEQSGTNNQCTSVQIAAYIYSLTNGDCTATGTGGITCTKTNGTAFSGLATASVGTGVITALGVNVGTAGAFVVNGGALGTPSSGVGTNLTGTAAGLTAGNVTTNANLTGAITSAGNATSLGSFSSAQLLAALTVKTGTGSAVFGSAPTIDSPTITTALTLGFATGGGTQCLQVSNTGATTPTGSACGGSGSTGANPTATGSDTATNGVATTFLRSDASFAIQKTSSSLFGLAKVDNTTITASGGVIAAVNTGTVTSVGAGCGTSTGGSAITTTGNVLAAFTKRANATTSDPIVAADCGNLVTESNAASIAVAIAQAGTTGFASGTFFSVCNIGAGTATITPTISTIGGASTLAIPGGSQAAPVCYTFQSDGTNYNLSDGPTVNASLLTVGTLPAGRMPALTGDVTASAGSTATTLAAGNAGNLNSGTLLAARMPALTGDCTTSAGAVATTCTKTSGTAFGALATVTAGTGVATAAAANLSAAGGITSTIASGTAALGTSSIGSAACATVVTVTATNVATTDTLTASFNGDPTAVTGYIPSTSGILTIVTYPTSGNVNFKVCNNTASPVTPGAITLNWRVVR